MKGALTRVYRQNRARFPVDDLKPYDGQWVAFSADGRRIVASAENIGQLSDRVTAARQELQDVVLERIEVETGDIRVGGTELF